MKRLHGRVLVPTHVFKAVHDPERRQAAAYVAPNAPGDTWTVVSIAELRRMTGLDVFPRLPAAMKDTPMALPPPVGPRHPRNAPVR